MKKAGEITQDVTQASKIAGEFSWQQSKNVVGDALNSITGGYISSVGDKDSFMYKATNTAVDWAPIPATKIGKVLVVKLVK